MKKDRLSNPKDCRYVVSYHLTPGALTVSLLGFIRLRRVALSDVRYLRLASSDEVSHTYFFRNWSHFRPGRARYCPIYVLRTRKRNKRIFLKLRSGAHFRLRRAIGEYKVAPLRQMPTEPPVTQVKPAEVS
jgi:hypothetical protein